MTTEQWREEFPVLSRGVYLLSNALGATPRGVEAMMARYTDELFTQGEGAWSTWYPWVLEAADQVGRLIGAPPGTVTLDSSVSTLHHRIASCFHFSGERRRIVMSSLDFPSVRYAWENWSRYGAERIVVGSPDGIRVPMEALLAAIDERTLVVSLSLASYCSGALLDLEPVVRRAHEVGAIVVVDAFQAFGVVPIDVVASGVDVLVSGTRKFAMGGGESAFMYVCPSLIRSLEPVTVGWFAHRDPFAFAPELELADGITRFQMGTPLVLPHYVASAGWEILAEVGIPEIRRRSLVLTDAIIAHADALGLELATPREHAERAGVVCLRFPDAERVARALNAKNLFCSYRPSSGLRLGPHFYNTLEEIDRFMIALAAERG